MGTRFSYEKANEWNMMGANNENKFVVVYNMETNLKVRVKRNYVDDNGAFFGCATSHFSVAEQNLHFVLLLSGTVALLLVILSQWSVSCSSSQWPRVLGDEDATAGSAKMEVDGGGIKVQEEKLVLIGGMKVGDDDDDMSSSSWTTC
ncbi:hypothetical protein DEO72_LG10g2400 [Vigna unguiculata]|uniref:Uncharacterized protein n=1 Tax=Vigna unguiculata TaxID=3917 RepID=A0A4D6NGV6_VIGUN|nr:hypothetical protein DEO72_LG10g2400 [Vigna unguiculata]